MSPWLHNECTSKEKTYRLSGIVSRHLIIVIGTHELLLKVHNTNSAFIFLINLLWKFSLWLIFLQIVPQDNILANCHSRQFFPNCLCGSFSNFENFSSTQTNNWKLLFISNFANHSFIMHYHPEELYFFKSSFWMIFLQIVVLDDLFANSLNKSILFTNSRCG